MRLRSRTLDWKSYFKTGRRTKDEGRRDKDQGDSSPFVNLARRLIAGRPLAAVALVVLLLGVTIWGMAANPGAQSAVVAGPATSPMIASSSAAGIVNLHMSNTPYGPPVTQFPEGTSIVYVVFDYYYTANTPIQVRVYSPQGAIIFDQTQTYSGDGTASVSVPGSFPPSPPPTYYVTNVYLEDNPTPAGSVSWQVAGTAGTPTPTPPTGTGTICALVYEDLNGNQTRDFGEALLAGAIITLTDANRLPLYTYTTDGMHEPHCFTGLTPYENYYVLEQDPPNYSSTTSNILVLTPGPGVTLYAEFGDRIPVVPTETPTLVATPTPTATPVRRLFLPLIMKSHWGG